MSAAPDNFWPDDASGGVTFLLDCLSKTERSILGCSIREQCPMDAQFETIDLNLRQRGASPASVSSLAAHLEAPDERYLVPLRVSWEPPPVRNRRGISLRDLFLGTAGEPGAIRQRWMLRRVPRAYQIVVGQGAALGELKHRLLQQSGGTGLEREKLAGFIAKSAFLALDRSERRLRGGRYKIPRMISEEVLARPALTAALAQFAHASGRPMQELEREARTYLAEMAAAHTTFGMDLAAALGRYMYTRGFDPTIDLLPSDLERVRALVNEQPVAFGFTHKSHVDGFMLVTLFHDLNLTPLHFFGGINMKFLGIGALMKRSGAIFIRRSFQDNPVYKAVFKNYIDYLGEKRFPVLWALEGTRSRTGKLVPLRYGLISYIVSAYLRDNAPDLVLMPIAVIYDQVPEVRDYDAMQAGAGKQPESASWFMQYVRRLKSPHGKIHVRFGTGVKLSDFIDVRRPPASLDQRVVRRIAFALAVDVNRVTPITANSLITYVMLSHGHQALTLAELVDELAALREWVRLRGLPTTADVARWDTAILGDSLNMLAAHGVVRIDATGLDPVYAIAPSAARQAAYYRNGMIHFMVPGAIAELALLAVTATGEGALQQLQREALNLRELLKFEFPFEGREEFIRSLKEELDGRCAGWQVQVAAGGAAPRELLQSMKVILAHATLRPFLEAYLLIAELLSLQPPGEPLDRRTLLARSHSLGRQRLLQQRIHCEESVSSSYFDNAISLAERRGLLGAEQHESGRPQFLQELRVAVSRTRWLASLVESRRFAAEVPQ
jgi:glycerol-3-phosphate O-acyltransferase